MFRIIRRIFWSIIALLVFWCAWSLFSHRMPWQKGKKTTNELKVLTYNTHAMMIGESLDSKLAMLQYINRLDADIVCLQEVLV